MPTTEERLAKIEQMLGLAFADRPITDADLKPANEIPGSGRYPWVLSDFQIHTDLAAVWREIAKLQAAIQSPQQEQPPASAVTPGRTILGEFDPQLSAILDGQLFIGDRDSVAIYFQSDMSNTDPQRAGNRPDSHFHPTAPHIGAIVKARDGGLRFFNNFAYIKLDDGSFVPIIPDPSRYGRSVGFDAEGMWSDQIHVPMDQPDAQGFYRVKFTQRGQHSVVIPDMNGDVTIRLPQGGHLYEERGDGRMGANPNGHRETVSRRRVVTEGDYPPARGGLHG